MSNYEIEFKKTTGREFGEFYNDYKPKLKWHLSTMTNDLELAEDFAHEALIQGLEKLHQFDREKSQIQTWITTIGRNLVIKEFYDKQKLPSTSLDKEVDDDSTLVSFIAYDDGHELLYKEKENKIKCKLVLEAIKKLPAKYKEVIEMREIERLSYKEISEILNINLSTIKSQIRKGRQLIISMVKKDFKLIEENGI